MALLQDEPFNPAWNDPYLTAANPVPPSNTSPPPTTPAPNPNTITGFGQTWNLNPKGGGGGGGGGGVSGGPASPSFEFGAVPKFDAPAFVRPDAKSLLSAPGYQARQQAGEAALQRSAASKGLLRTGGTLKDLIEYGQNFASNEYNNEFNQALQTYGANYQLSKDKYAPLLAQWDLLSKAEIQKQLAAYNRGTIWDNPHAGGGGGGSTYDPFPSPNDF